MNVATFAGRVGTDAELRYTGSGTPVASFSMAIDTGKDGSGERREPLWIKAVLWQKKAEALAQYIKKGNMVVVSGPVDVEAWIASSSGEAKGKVVVTVREFTFAGGKNDASENHGPASGAVQPPARESAPISDDDIPF